MIKWSPRVAAIQRQFRLVTSHWLICLAFCLPNDSLPDSLNSLDPFFRLVSRLREFIRQVSKLVGIFKFESFDTRRTPFDRRSSNSIGKSEKHLSASCRSTMKIISWTGIRRQSLTGNQNKFPFVRKIPDISRRRCWRKILSKYSTTRIWKQFHCNRMRRGKRLTKWKIKW